ncbi:MAG: hypothetical protein KIT82_13165 [Bradyrhizobium sp.]|nr:hypothetical protein [Bradyrhizobium sp.]
MQREEHVFGAFDISHYRPQERPNSVKIVHPKNGEEAWWPLFDETGEALFPDLMAELDAIKQTTASGIGLSARPPAPPVEYSASMDQGSEGLAIPPECRKRNSGSSWASERALF